MKNLPKLFTILALLLSHVMCIVVAFHYSYLLHCGRHGGCSAPAYVAFFYAIPFLIGIAVCVILSLFFHRQSTTRNA